MKRSLFFLLFFSQSLLAQKLPCQLSGTIVPVAEYQTPTNVFTRLKNDGHPMMAFGFLVSESKALENTKAVRDYCDALNNQTRTVILSGQYPDGHFQKGQRLSLRHVHEDKHVWPYWPDRYDAGR